MSGSNGAGVAGTRCDHHRPHVSVHHSPRAITAGTAIRDRCFADSKETRPKGRSGCGQVRWPLSTRRTCYQRRDCGGVGKIDHGSDWPSECSDGAEVYPGWEFVQGEQRWKVRVIGPSRSSSPEVTSRYRQISRHVCEYDSTPPDDCRSPVGSPLNVG